MTTPGEVDTAAQGRALLYSGGLKLLESIVRTPEGRRVLRVEVHGACSGAERGAWGSIGAFETAWPRQADFVLVNLRNATAYMDLAPGFREDARKALASQAGALLFSEAGDSIAFVLTTVPGVQLVPTDQEALVRFDRIAAEAGPATGALPPAEGWKRDVTVGACEFHESIVLSPQGRRVMRLAPQGSCIGGDWMAGRACREHLETLADLANFVLVDTAASPTWADAACAAAWVLRSQLKARGGDCVLVGTHPGILRAVKPLQWKVAADEKTAFDWIDRGL
jgi:hypothetical protein